MVVILVLSMLGPVFIKHQAHNYFTSDPKLGTPASCLVQLASNKPWDNLGSITVAN